MTTAPGQPAGEGLRWAARIWSGAAFALAAVQFLFRQAPSEPLPAVDWLLLAFWGLALLGLALAWRWAVAGSLLTLAAMLLREITFFLVKGFWSPAFLLIWAVVVPPALLFLAAWVQAGRANRAARP